jgi:hypothetical protein
MATILEKRSKMTGEIISYKFMCCVGRDEMNKQIWRIKTIERPDGLTPVKEQKEVQRIASEWEREQKAEYARTHSKDDKMHITLAAFIQNHWWPDHVLNGDHTPKGVEFFRYTSDKVIEYFGTKKLGQIDAEAVKRYVKWLRTEARTIPMSPRVYDLLQKFRAEQTELFGKVEDTDFIFCSPESAQQPIYPTVPTKWQARFVERNKLPHVSPHDLRHTAATLALESGASLKQVQMLMGHSNPATTMQYYTGVTEEAQKRTVEGIENLLA